MEEFKKNDLVTVTIEDVGTDGEGIGKVSGFTLFVKDAVPGDTVTAKIMKSKKNYAYAKLEKVVTPSPFRVSPPCSFHRQCGGCQLQALDYKKQLEFKQQKITGNLIRIGGFSPEYVAERMEPIVGMEHPLHYRNKAQYPVGTGRDGNIITGFYAGRTHSIIANTDCLLGDPGNREILEQVLEYMRENHVSAYDETTGKGLVRHILIRKGFTSKEWMVCLVISGRAGSQGGKAAKKSGNHIAGKSRETNRREEFLPRQDRLLERLTAIPGMTSISVNINSENTNVILGREGHTIWGSPVITDTIHARDMQREGYPYAGDALQFKISPLSFYQVNPVQTEKLYSLALEYAGLTGKETVWDLYCGIGTISLFLAKKAKQVYGVEIIEQAILDARENAKLNGIENARFFVGKAEEVLPDYYAGKAEEDRPERYAGKAEEDRPEHCAGGADMLHPDVIVVDPPRKGCDSACLDTMLKMQPDRIVYVSCDSATLARDLKILCDGGYEIKKIRGVDQFAMTVHVETVVLLCHQNIKKAATVDYVPDGSYMKGLNKHATYKEINEYVQEKYGFRLHSAYIAQVKREMGIEMGENYNL
ncbi:MAG: class I SAM-dependent RNA methyltransferase, partial [Lachnospiraceae bacterium]|nr:class I SAM-dependent RNA methyltransferase [Lachnospiraceae bacterium]